MKSSWPQAKLEDLTPPDSAITYGVIKPGGEGSVRFVRGGDIAAGIVLEEELRTITAAVSEQYKRTLLRGGELLMSLVGQPGQVAVASVNLIGANIARQVGLIRLRREFDPYFISYFLRSPDGVAGLRKFTGGSVQQVINLGDLRHVSVPTPALTEQRRIVAILDEAFEGIATAKANAERNLQNARQVFENHLERVFARRCDLWPETNLGAIAAIKGGKRVPKGYKLLHEDTGYPYLRVTDFGPRGSIDMNDLRYISPAVHAEIKSYIITPRDLYISIAGTIGRTGIIPGELDGANLTENACRLVFNTGVSNRFVYYYTKTPAFIEQAGFNTRTAAQPKLALSRLATIRLPMPKLEVQESVVAALDVIVEGVQALEGIYQSKATALDDLQKSLLHQAFTGQL